MFKSIVLALSIPTAVLIGLLFMLRKELWKIKK